MLWQTIPQAPDYEINHQGVVRNRKTGYILKWQEHCSNHFKQITLRTGGKKICLTLPNLMWQLFGRRSPKTPIPVSVSNGNRRKFFDSCRACSFFLAQDAGISQAAVWNRLARRKNLIGNRRINYLL